MAYNELAGSRQRRGLSSSFSKSLQRGGKSSASALGSVDATFTTTVWASLFRRRKSARSSRMRSMADFGVSRTARSFVSANSSIALPTLSSTPGRRFLSMRSTSAFVRAIVCGSMARLSVCIRAACS